ncbi:MAG: hypothetical protein U5J63_16915 [Fodinibius sp.]|nr:hypothetical protein [Fodinibius sp.]
MATSKLLQRCLLICILWLGCSEVWAQNEIARERSSLKGIQAMGFTVNIESNKALDQQQNFDVSSLRSMGQEVLRKAKIDIIADNEVQSSSEIPFLYLHINSMDAGQGLVPFALTLYFYQPVELVLNRNQQTSSITWESGSVGIVSYDQMALIPDAAKNLIQEFTSDYKQVNGSN